MIPAGHGMLGDMAVGVWAQLVAGVVYTPIDIVKERLQVLCLRDRTDGHCQRLQLSAFRLCVSFVRPLVKVRCW